MAATPDPLYPAGSASDPVIRWIDQAIDQARQKLPTLRPADAGDPYYVLVFALNVIINTREQAVGQQHPFCSDMNLVYADHYLHMRVNAFNAGPKARDLLLGHDAGYDMVKSKAMKHDFTRRLLKTGVCDPSPVTAGEMMWSWRGLQDGLEDYRKYPDKSILPVRHPLNFIVSFF